MREFAISFDESASFARLSGDFNPLHVDPVRARRTQYGRTVVHGVHALLRALDGVGEAMSLDRFEPIAIACTFSGPIATDAVVRVDARLNASSDKLRLVGETGGRSAFSLTVDLQPARAGRFDRLAGSDFEPVAPRTQAMPAPGQEETSPIQLASARYSSLFPWLARGCNADWVGDLIATTRIIGMECPGMHSIYSGFKLRRSTGASVNAERMRYRVEKSDPRFRLVRLSVAGAVLEGTVEAFLRPAPVDQQSLADICSKVGETSFLGQRALVIGGSRGLGELTAKILLAGGGDVTITYALGRDDAQRISDEAKALGRRCSTMHLDVTAPMPEVMAKSLSATSFSHVYFFASPQISKNRAGRWDHELFDSFCRVYLRAFAMVAEVVLSGEKHLQDPVRMFFPSTIFLDRPEDGFAEYCSSKAAGEALCDYFAGKHRAVFARPRLPRMRTDQTSGLSSFDAEEPFAVMHPVLLGFRSASRDPGA